jgi:hypothetical protein
MAEIINQGKNKGQIKGKNTDQEKRYTRKI